MTEYDWKSFSFGSGGHRTREDGLCIMEAVAYVAGEAHSDHPQCACPVLSAFCRAWNDGLPSDEERAKWLSEFVWRLPGTRSTPDIQLRRSEIAFDWLARTWLPAFLELSSGLRGNAEDLRSLPELGVSNFDLAVPVVAAAGVAARDAAGVAAGVAAWDAAWAAAGAAAGDAAGDAAWAAARDAAWDVARDVAGVAAWDVAGDVAGDVTGDAAWDVARAAAWAAAWAAAGAAARDAIKPTVEEMKQSARDLLDRMIALTEIKEAEIADSPRVPEKVTAK